MAYISRSMVDVFEMWLKTIGITCNLNSCTFTYNGTDCKWAFYNHCLAIDVGYDLGINRGWADLDLNVENIDIRDPSFDPGIFFAPFKKWLDENT